MSSPYKDYPLRQSRMEADPYTPVIVEDLMTGLNEWRSVPDIVRLTFKALSDVVKSQGMTLKDLESQFPNTVFKSDLTSGLALKVNVSDISRTVSELKGSLESKVNIDDIYSLVEDKVSRSEIHHLLSSKVNLDELRGILDSKADLRDIQAELRSLRASIEEVAQQSYNRYNSLVTYRELQKIEQALEAKANASEVNEALQEKANKQSVANALHRKANRADLDAQFASKADSKDLEAVMTLLADKADRTTLKELTTDIERKADKGSINLEINKASEVNTSYKKDMERAIEDLASKFQDTKNMFSEFQSTISSSLSKKPDYGDLDKIFQALSKKAEADHILQSLASLKNESSANHSELLSKLKFETKTMGEDLEAKLQRLETANLKLQEDYSKQKEMLRNFTEVNRNEVQDAIKYLQEYSSSLQSEGNSQISKEIGQLFRELDDLKAKKLDKLELRKYIDLSDLKENLEKQSRETWNDLQETRDLIIRKERELRAFCECRPTFEEVGSLILEHRQSNLQGYSREVGDIKSDLITYFERDIRALRESCEHNSREIMLKASIKEISSLLDGKASIQDINNALSDLQDELAGKASLAELNAHINEQAMINEVVCAETCVGRWIWKSGHIRNGHAIPWEVQSVNTCPDNFMWEAEKTSVLALTPGLYEVVYGVFSRSKPEVQLLVNGEAVINDGSPLSKVWGRHPSGNVVGMTCIDFLALPARARISLTYAGDPGAEGFLGLRKI